MTLNYNAVPFEMSQHQSYINSNYGNEFFQRQFVRQRIFAGMNEDLFLLIIE
jgi:hypothetical protein